MSDMPNKEALPFIKGQDNNEIHQNDEFVTDGSSALKPEPIFDDIAEKQTSDAEIGKIKESIIRPENILPFTNAEAIPRQRGIGYGEVEKKEKKVKKNDGGTGGEKKKGRGLRVFAGFMAGAAAVGGIAYGLFKDQIVNLFGGGINPNNLPPGQTVSASGEMPSQSENIESPTPSAEVTPEVTATPEVTEAPTPTLDEFGFSEERKAELNQQFQDFLNKQGEFTPEKMSLIMMETLSNLDKNEVGLGIIDTADVPRIQGYFFDYLEKDGRVFLFVGFDGKDGNRFITPIEIPIYFYESFEQPRFPVTEYKKNSVSISREEMTIEDYSDNMDKLMLLINTLKGRVIVFRLESQKFPEPAGDDLDLNAKDRDTLNTYLEYFNFKVELSFGLYQLLPQNNILPYENPYNIKGDSESVLRLNSAEEMSEININQVPITKSITYFKDR